MGLCAADIFCLVAAVAILFGFAVTGFCVAIAVGVFVSRLLGLGGMVGWFVAFLFGLFLSVYVWEPRVKKRVMAAFAAITSDAP
jgi:hypothetical protein